MTRRFCDVCDQEMKPEDSERVTGEVGPMRFQIMVGISPVWNGADICHDCVFDAVASLDHRPRATSCEHPTKVQ